MQFEFPKTIYNAASSAPEKWPNVTPRRSNPSSNQILGKYQRVAPFGFQKQKAFAFDLFLPKD